MQTDAVLFQVLQHFSGAVFDLVFQQKGRLKTALITQENNAACVVDMGKVFGQITGNFRNKRRFAQSPNLGFAIKFDLRADAVSDTVDPLLHFHIKRGYQAV